jgi:hypothetical protein
LRNAVIAGNVDNAESGPEAVRSQCPSPQARKIENCESTAVTLISVPFGNVFQVACDRKTNDSHNKLTKVAKVTLGKGRPDHF